MKIGFEDGEKMKEPCIRTSMLVFLLLFSVLGIWIWIFVAGTSKSLTIHIKTQSLGLLRAHQAYGLSEAFHFFSTSSTCHSYRYLPCSENAAERLVPSGSQVIQPYCVGLGALVGRAAAGCFGAKAFVSECLRAIQF